jgi:hypothetical protein
METANLPTVQVTEKVSLDGKPDIIEEAVPNCVLEKRPSNNSLRRFNGYLRMR